jgi:CHASE3 domain sensor protein
MNSQPLSNRKVQLTFGSVILSLLVVTLLLLGALSYRGRAVTRESDRWVRHTHEVLEHIQELFAAMQTAESSYRGFLITGDEQSLSLSNHIKKTYCVPGGRQESSAI